MSLSYSDCLSHLLCSEDSSKVLATGVSPAFSSDIYSPSNFEEESITGFIEEERRSFSAKFPPVLSSDDLDSSYRSNSVAWIFKVRSFYGFQAVTAYLAVNYFDRFLSSHHLSQTGGWPLQLLSVACLSLAAKMEEPVVPSLLDLQVEGAKFIFEPKTVLKMELLVLGALDWRLRLVTPFDFLSVFAYKLEATGLLVARSIDIVVSSIREASFVDYWSSSIAAAAVLCAANEMPSLAFVTPEHALSWCDGLSKDKVSNCYKLMQRSMADQSRRMCIKVIPKCRVIAQINRTRSNSESSSSSSSSSLSSSTSLSSSSSSSPAPYHNKKRRLS